MMGGADRVGRGWGSPPDGMLHGILAWRLVGLRPIQNRHRASFPGSVRTNPELTPARLLRDTEGVEASVSLGIYWMSG